MVDISWVWVGQVIAAGAVGLLLGQPLRTAMVRYAVPAGQGWREPSLLYGPEVAPAPRVVGAVTGWVMAALATRIADPARLATCCWLAALGVVLWHVDQSVQRLPDPLTMVAFAGVAALSSAPAVLAGQPSMAMRPVEGGILLAGVYVVLFLISPGGIGAGDAKLALSIGAVLGWHGWAVTLLGAAMAFLLCGLAGAALLVMGRVGPKDSIPHGPYMLLGVFALAVSLG